METTSQFLDEINDHNVIRVESIVLENTLQRFRSIVFPPLVLVVDVGFGVDAANVRGKLSLAR